MLPILQNQSVLTMTSLEIAELVKCRHDSVKRTIQRLVDSGSISNPPLVDGDKSANGVVPQFYKIGKRDSYVIVAQLSPEFTAVLVDRWQELEQQQAPALPKSFAEALRLAADQQEIIEKQSIQIEHQKPAVEFVERYVESTGNLGFRQVCKLLKAKENAFREFLESERVMYKLGGDWVPYACHIDAKRFHLSTGTSDNDHNYTASKFTPKGIEWIARLWDRYQYNNRPLAVQ
jgi:phage antirepressor YoqD-like protein